MRLNTRTVLEPWRDGLELREFSFMMLISLCVLFKFTCAREEKKHSI